MAKLSYFRRIVTPSINLISTKLSVLSKASDYFRILRDAYMPGRTLIPGLVAVMTTKCSLKCIKCNNLMTCYDEPYDRPIDELIADLDAVLSGVDSLVDLSLIGGEPFLYPDLEKVLDYVIKNKKIMYVNLTSNGTIIPKENILKKLKNKKLMVIFSDYGVKTQKIDLVKSAFAAHGVRFDYKKDLTWVDPGENTSRGKSVEKLKKEYINCFSAKYCKTLLNGKIYACSRGAHLHDLGFMDEPQDYMDVYEANGKAEQGKALKEFYLRDYCMACDHCDHALGREITPGEQKETCN